MLLLACPKNLLDVDLKKNLLDVDPDDELAACPQNLLDVDSKPAACPKDLLDVDPDELAACRSTNVDLDELACLPIASCTGVNPFGVLVVSSSMVNKGCECASVP